MSAKRLYPNGPKHNKGRLGVAMVLLLLVIGYQQAGIGANLSVNDTSKEAELSEQLKINKNALLEGKKEQIRTTAATVMLFSEEPQARIVLLNTLKQSENRAAQAAVCKALSQTRATKKPIKNKDNFIQPLLDILIREDFAGAKLAAEATLIFKYGQISSQLEEIAKNAALPAKPRFNAVYALKIQPDMRATIQLIKLLDDPESQVAAEADKALRSLGVPLGEDAKTRRQIIKQLERRGQEPFLRDRLIHQGDQIRNLEDKLDLLQERYLWALGTIYNGIKDDTGKAGEFLAKHLRSLEVTVRLWALEKIYQDRIGTQPKKLSTELLGPILVRLISDQDKNVRLKTANLLSLLWQLDTAEKLLEQLKIEQDEQVGMELFIALGGACYYASLPNSPVKLSPEIIKQTLEWAAKYLVEPDSKKAQKGAEVMKKLLEQNQLKSVELGRYLGLLRDRYNQQNNDVSRALCGELLSKMAELCANNSVCRTESIKLFGPLFKAALRDETNLVREAAMVGLINIDKTKALKILRKDFANDPSIKVRQRLIVLAGEVGGKADLPWLAEKIGTTDESDRAWQAMLEIFNFKSSDAAVLNEWVANFDSPNAKAKLSDEQRITFLKIAEQKAVSEKKVKMLKAVRRKLADLYKKTGKFEQAAECLGLLHQVAQTNEEKEAILLDLLEVYLRWPNLEQAGQLVANRLLGKDLDPNDVFIGKIEQFLNSSDAATAKKLLEELTKIDMPEQRLEWQAQMKSWTERFEPGKEPNKPEEAGG